MASCLTGLDSTTQLVNCVVHFDGGKAVYAQRNYFPFSKQHSGPENFVIEGIHFLNVKFENHSIKKRTKMFTLENGLLSGP